MARKLKGGGWSFKQERRVLELAAQSKSPEEIANLMSRSPDAIRKVAIRLGISLSKNKRPCHHAYDVATCDQLLEDRQNEGNIAPALEQAGEYAQGACHSFEPFLQQRSLALSRQSSRLRLLRHYPHFRDQWHRRATEKGYEFPPLHCRPLAVQFAPAMTLPLASLRSKIARGSIRNSTHWMPSTMLPRPISGVRPMRAGPSPGTMTVGTPGGPPTVPIC